MVSFTTLLLSLVPKRYVLLDTRFIDIASVVE
jgi:hypothetical protein